jgi:hypothetical protein
MNTFIAKRVLFYTILTVAAIFSIVLISFIKAENKNKVIEKVNTPSVAP